MSHPSGQYLRDLDVEAEGLRRVTPLLTKFSRRDADLVWTTAFRSNVFAQEVLGDVIVQGAHETVMVEVKAERAYTGNLFVEVWSNRVRWRGRRGWADHLQADYLLAVYLDAGVAALVDLPGLWSWCHERGGLRRYPERVVRQSRDGRQPNVTTGVPVPFHRLAADGVRVFFYAEDDADPFGWSAVTIGQLQSVAAGRTNR